MRHVPVPEEAVAEFGRRIRERRAALRLTQQAVADAIGVDRGHVSFMESGDRPPSFGSMLALARALRVDAGVLVRGLQKVPPTEGGLR